MVNVLAERYEVQRQLGKGAGRHTLLALDRQTQQQVVIKLMIFGTGLKWEDLKLFEREAETLRSLSHPRIPRYLDSFEVDTFQGKGFALVQTYIKAQTLENQLRAGRSFTDIDLQLIAKSILEILIYLHVSSTGAW